VINYHWGTMLPVGTKVSVSRLESDKIVFNKEDDLTYVNFTIAKGRRYVDIDDDVLLKRYFSDTNPFEGERFSKFSDEEKNNIKEGKIAAGMSKDAVVMAYGYPPTDKTPNLTDDVWQYRAGRVSFKIIFKDDKIVELIGMEKAIRCLGKQK